MLGSLTILHNPLVKIVDNLTDKYKRRETALVCNEILAYDKVLAEYARDMFKSGCITTVREKLLSEAKTEQQKQEVHKIFKERSSLEFDKADNYCSMWASEYELQGKISKNIMSNMFYEMECDKLGRTNEEAIMEIYRIAEEVRKETKEKK